MITKSDCMSILVKMEDQGINIDAYMKKLIVSKDIPLEVLKFINESRGLEVGNFYEMLRKNHNKKKSPLYKNIVSDLTEIPEIITTLSCLLTQIILYSRKLNDNSEFLKEVRAEEVSRVLNGYFKSGNYSDCVTLLRLIKSDLLVLEYIAGRRDLA